MIRFIILAIAFSTTSLLLAGCGGVSPMAGSGVQASMGASRAGYAGDLLYVAHGDGLSGRHGVVSILTLPAGKPYASIKFGYLSGICSDTSGNVWLVVWKTHPHGYYLDEYAHGGTAPIAEVRIPKGGFGFGCAVDPTSGDLAVMSPSESTPYRGSIDVWTTGYKGEPAIYDVPFVPENGAYDDSGNLFIDGKPGGSDIGALFADLAKGSRAVMGVKVDRHTSLAGGVQWDGKYFAFQTGGYHPFMKGPPRIYRVEISGTSGHVVGADIPSEPQLYGVAWFALEGDSVISMAGDGSQLDVWPYPIGGPHTAHLGRFRYIRGLTISVGSAHR